MEAILSSPSSILFSPDSSFNSSYNGSPNLPDFSSPMSLANSNTSKQQQQHQTITTPTRTPAWLVDDLEEEWIDQDDQQQQLQEQQEERDEIERQQEEDEEYDLNHNQPSHHPDQATPRQNTLYFSPQSVLRSATHTTSILTSNSTSTSTGSPTIIAAHAPVYSSSSLRPISRASNRSVLDDAEKGAGTFVVRESPVGSMIIKEVNTVGDQLRAAVKALKGKSSGLGGESERLEEVSSELVTPIKMNDDRLGGLMKLFQPPLSATSQTPLPSSTIPAPSIPSFDFTPPAIPRTSWKSIPHFSPTDVSTPMQSNTTAIQQKVLAPKHRERYIRTEPVVQRLAASITSTTLSSSSSTSSSAPSADFSSPHPDELRFTASSPYPLTPAPAAPESTFFTTPQLPSSASIPGLRLFEFQYDTFTRDHLAALVEEIDGLGSGQQTQTAYQNEMRGREKTKEVEDEEWETSFVEVKASDDLVDREGSVEGEEGEGEGDATARASKRIRLSPAGAAAVAASTSRRSRESILVTPMASTRRSRRRSNNVVAGASKSIERGFNTTLGASLSRRRDRSLSNLESPVPSPTVDATMRNDRLVTADAVLDRIRARTAEKPRATFVPAVELTFASPSSPRQSQSSMISISRRRRAEDNQGVASSSSKTSPRKFSRQLSLSSVDSDEHSPALSRSNVIMSTSTTRSTLGAPPTTIQTRLGSPLVIQKTSFATTLVASSSSSSVSRSQRVSVPAVTSFVDQNGKGTIVNKLLEEDPFREFTTTDANAHESNLVIVESGLSGLGITASGGGLTPVLVVQTPPTNLISLPLEAVREELSIELLEEDVEGAEEEEEEDVEEGEEFELENENESVTETYEFDREESPFELYQVAVGVGTDVMDAEMEVDEEAEEERSEGAYPGSVLPLDIGSPLILSVGPPLFDAQLLTTTSTIRLSPTSASTSLSLSPSSALVTPRPASRVPLSSIRPRSALKPTTRSQSDTMLMMTTPDRRYSGGEPRSVSFEDGKSQGPIRPSANGKDALATVGSSLKFELGDANESLSEGEAGFVPMSRGSEVDLDLEREFAMASTKVNMNDQDDSFASESSTSTARAPLNRSQSQSRTFRRTTAADATFLTECSFGVSQDRILKLITDVSPFEPDWEGMKSLDLAGKGVESLIRLKEFLPRLDEVNLARNEISYLTGLSSTLRTLLIPSNKLTSIVSFAHLLNLERIDISQNQIDSVAPLACLKHLRELKADGNLISDLGGLAKIDGLIRLSLKGNAIQSLDFSVTNWTRLETLDLSRNKITVVVNLDHLQSLSFLNLDYNRIRALDPSTKSMPRLRVLRICYNPLQTLDLTFAPKLRTLFSDSTRLGPVEGTDKLSKLENLSVRDQSSNENALTMRMGDIRDVKRLYLSGNPVPTSFPSEKFFNLVYLELAMCQITTLPSNLAELIPNVRTLNLNFNFISDLMPLKGLTRVKKLSVLGARLMKCRPLLAVLETMTELESIDLRMNPLTLAYYPPLLLQSVSTASALPSHSEYQILHPDDDDHPARSSLRSQSWECIDHKFKKALPDEWLFKRLSYRSVILKSCPTVMNLDGIQVTEKERVAGC